MRVGPAVLTSTDQDQVFLTADRPDTDRGTDQGRDTEMERDMDLDMDTAEDRRRIHRRHPLDQATIRQL